MPISYNKNWFSEHYIELIYILLCSYDPINPGTTHWKKAVQLYDEVNKLNLEEEQLNKYTYNLRKCTANPLNTITRIYKETQIQRNYISTNNLEILVQLENLYGEKYKEKKISLHPYLKEKTNFKSFRNMLLIFHTPRQILLKVKAINLSD